MLLWDEDKKRALIAQQKDKISGLKDSITKADAAAYLFLYSLFFILYSLFFILYSLFFILYSLFFSL
jgi:hypothetical protein